MHFIPEWAEGGIFALTAKRKFVKSPMNKAQKYAFLLKNAEITRVNQVWSTSQGGKGGNREIY
jgi:hypothetical protein